MSIILEYVWIDGYNKLRSKYKTIYHIENIDDNWTYDGSSTGQASGHDSDIFLVPVKKYKNPFFKDCQSFLILCETFNGKNSPTLSNKRYNAKNIFEKKPVKEPWFGIEQEYFIMERNGTQNPIETFFFKEGNIKEQKYYYCGVGSQNIKYRQLVEKHYQYCLDAGLKISGVNAEVAPNQWEFQIGPCEGIDAGDELWIARYILEKLSEEFNVVISYEPKPFLSPWNGSGQHTNFSTKESRDKDGLKILENYIEKLADKHHEHLEVYGNNSKRLKGDCETSDINTFSAGFGNRGCSIRIPKNVMKDKKGYLEDRRPASDADPYEVTSKIFETCCF